MKNPYVIDIDMSLLKNICLIGFLVGVCASSAHSQSLQAEFFRSNLWSSTLVGAPFTGQQIKAQGRITLPITVAVIDSGVSLLHPLLLGQLQSNPQEISGNNRDDDFNSYKDDFYGYDFVNDRGFMTDSTGHGTHVAGIISAINPQARILALKVLNSDGYGSVAKIIEAIRYAVSRGARVINLSLGAMDVLGQSAQGYAEAIRIARNNGVLVVAAAGNDSNDNDRFAFYPSNTWEDNLVSVCAVNDRAQLTSFSNYGRWKVHLCAPGFQITSLNSSYFSGALWISQNGTSQAAPFVAGTASILFGLKPDLKPFEVRNLIMETAKKYPHLRERSQTGGVLYIPGAIDLLFQKYYHQQ